MRPLNFKQANITFAKDQPEYEPLPAYRSPQGEVITCWEFTEAEIREIKKNKVMFFRQLTFNNPLQPIQPLVDNPFEV